ncbi:hypothetical protein [Intestinibacter bartlettii]|uniref:Uncharacterized protein n=1 Tax=Intestinibacter bartlettii TaxID=261299 RepID=A0ABS6DVZ2_9FIRM|nr:hypothetical protein [Intestinibacter bartlettii]MBU5336021.1 hypothetical protein [Intestinibacter bartlettii]MDO5010098.1 hypothetical protein [Intestinibacter bartlettii]
MNTNEKFVYSYSAKQQKEIEEIRSKYLPKKENKLDEIRKLDELVTKKATIISIAIGLISTLVFGFGLCCILEWKETMFIQGLVIGIFGVLGIVSAFPLYNIILRKQRSKIAHKILKLSDELMDENFNQ